MDSRLASNLLAVSTCAEPYPLGGEICQRHIEAHHSPKTALSCLDSQPLGGPLALYTHCTIALLNASSAPPWQESQPIQWDAEVLRGVQHISWHSVSNRQVSKAGQRLLVPRDGCSHELASPLEARLLE